MATVGKVNIFPHDLSPSFTPVASSSSSSVSLVHVHNAKMECQNKTKKQTNKNKTINRCCRCYGDGGQIHGHVWEGCTAPIN